MLWMTLIACGSLEPIASPDLDALDPVDRAQVELGRALFFDPGLSADGSTSCATCHRPEVHGAETRTTSEGVGGAVGNRNAPSVLNAGLKEHWFWDGRAATLEEQAFGPLYAPVEMAQTEDGLSAHVQATHPDALRAAFPDEPFQIEQVGIALAAFQRTLASPSRFDRHLNGDDTALTPTEKAGAALFQRHCAVCHDGPGIGGRRIEKLGRREPWPDQTDAGLFEVTGDPADHMRFVVPSLRNVQQTGPWFHDGQVETLDEAVRLMGRHQVGITFSEDAVQQLVAFLGSLDAEEVPAWFAPPEPR